MSSGFGRTAFGLRGSRGQVAEEGTQRGRSIINYFMSLLGRWGVKSHRAGPGDGEQWAGVSKCGGLVSASPCQEPRGGRCCPARSACCSLRYIQPPCPDRGSPPSRWGTRNQKPTSFPCSSSLVAAVPSAWSLSYRQGLQLSGRKKPAAQAQSLHSLLGDAKHTGTCSSKNVFLLQLSQLLLLFFCLLRVSGSIDFLWTKQWIFSAASVNHPTFHEVRVVRGLHYPQSFYGFCGSKIGTVFCFSNAERKKREGGNCGWCGLDTEASCLLVPQLVRRKTFCYGLKTGFAGNVICIFTLKKIFLPVE